MQVYSISEIERVNALVGLNHDLTTKQAAIHLNLSPRTLEKYRVTGEGPRFRRYGRVVRYPVADLQEWKKARLFNSTSENSKH